MLELYCNDNINNFFKYYKRLKYDLIEFKNIEDNDNDRYIKIYEENYKNFHEIIL